MKKWTLLLTLIITSPLFFNANANAKEFAFAEALIWNVRESNASNWGQILYPSDPNETIEFLEVPFKWSPGIRVGVGYKGKEKPWDVVFYYTGYKTKGKSQANTESGQIHSAFSSNFYADNPQGNNITGPYYHHASIEWDVSYNTLDLELGRSIIIDPRLTLRLMTGLRAAAINQSINSNWQQPFQPTIPFTSATEMITNNFKGLGPSVGLDTRWNLYTTPKHTLSLIGNVSTAFLWSNWTFSDVYQNIVQRISTQSEDLSSSAWMAKTNLGIDWSTTLKDGSWNVRLGYEIQAWFNQLQYYSFDMGKTNDTLYLQGVVLGFGVHF